MPSGTSKPHFPALRNFTGFLELNQKCFNIEHLSVANFVYKMQTYAWHISQHHAEDLTQSQHWAMYLVHFYPSLLPKTKGECTFFCNPVCIKSSSILFTSSLLKLSDTSDCFSWRYQGWTRDLLHTKEWQNCVRCSDLLGDLALPLNHSPLL